MKFFLSTILISLASIVAGMFLPWWCIAVVSFGIVYLYRLKPGIGFLSGFTGVFVCWAIIALLRNSANESILANRIAMLFPLDGNGGLLVLISGLVGGLVGGLAGLSAGFLFRSKVGE